MVFTHTWRWKNLLGERHGHLCRILTRGRNGNILVEFEDGYKVVTLRYALLKRPTPPA